MRAAASTPADAGAGANPARKRFPLFVCAWCRRRGPGGRGAFREKSPLACNHTRPRAVTARTIPSPMKKPLSHLALLAGAMILALPLASAQSEPKGPPREGGKGGGRGRGPAIEMLTEQLGLTKEQADQLKPALEKQRSQMEALRGDESLSPEDRRARMRAIREATDTAIAAVLTPEQKKKRQEMRANRGPGGPGGERRGGKGKGERPRRT